MAKNKVTRDDIQKFIQEVNYTKVGTFAAIFITFGAMFYHFVEKFSWVDSFYFTFITLATIGYGDLAPKTSAGKIFTMFYALLGITLFVILAKIVLSTVVVQARRRKDKKDQ